MKKRLGKVTIGIDGQIQLWVLVKEEKGFIFRDPNNLRCGYRGHSETKDGAEHDFLTNTGKKIFTIPLDKLIKICKV